MKYIHAIFASSLPILIAVGFFSQSHAADQGGPRDPVEADKIVARSQEKNTIQKTSPQSPQKDNLLVSPFKGPADAPVVIDVFSDFQ
jgi:hypothetical protein